MTCTATHTFTQAELDANGSPVADSGELANTVTVSSDQAPDVTDEPVDPDRAVAGADAGEVGDAAVLRPGRRGDHLHVHGDEHGQRVGARPDHRSTTAGSTVICPPTTGLAPGESLTCTASHTVTQADLDAGKIVNVASATNGVVTSPPDTVTVGAVAAPLLEVVKSSPTTDLTAPQTVQYSYLVTNAGNVTLTGIALSDDNDANNLSVPEDEPRATRVDDLHGDAHVHAGGAGRERLAGRGQRRAREHRHGDVDPGASGHRQPRDPDRAEAGAQAREVGVAAVVQPGWPGDHLHVRGDEHRQRDGARADLGHRRQGDGGLSADGGAGAGRSRSRARRRTR